MLLPRHTTNDIKYHKRQLFFLFYSAMRAIFDSLAAILMTVIAAPRHTIQRKIIHCLAEM